MSRFTFKCTVIYGIIVVIYSIISQLNQLTTRVPLNCKSVAHLTIKRSDLQLNAM